MSKYTTFLIVLSLFLSMKTKAQETRQFKAYNGVKFDYKILLPEDYDPKKDYDLAMLFTQVERKQEGYESTLASLTQNKKLTNTILFVPEVPVGNPHWISHPIHHGLNDLMDELREEFGERNQRFHFIGHLFGGRVAQTYSGMSSQYVASVSFVNSKHWPHTKQQYFNQITGLGFPISVYDEKDKGALSIDVSKTSFKQVHGFEEALHLIDQAN